MTRSDKCRMLRHQEREIATLIRASGFFGADTLIKVQFGTPSVRVDKAKQRPGKRTRPAIVTLTLGSDWLETVHERGLMLLCGWFVMEAFPIQSQALRKPLEGIAVDAAYSVMVCSATGWWAHRYAALWGAMSAVACSTYACRTLIENNVLRSMGIDPEEYP